jgi:hypothetical protein
MDDQKILDNAPEGATHFDSDGEYAKDAGYGLEFFRLSWCAYGHPVELRSIADIKELVELRKANAELEAKCEVLKHANEGLGFEIAELEKEQGELNIQIAVLKHSDAEYYGLYSELLFSPNEPSESLEAHNLKQQKEVIDILYKAGKCDADCLEYFEALKAGN